MMAIQIMVERLFQHFSHELHSSSILCHCTVVMVDIVLKAVVAR